MSYSPLNYSQINLAAGHYHPSMVKSYNNEAFAFWERSLFQRAQSILLTDGLPDEWQGNNKDFLMWCILKFGFVAVFDSDKFGFSFQPCTLKGYDFYYQPTSVLIANPRYQAELELGKDCELLKITPDYMGVYDIITYYAEKLAVLDNAINMSLVNNKFAYFLGARNKGMAEAIKKMMDKINRGEPAVIYDQKIVNDTVDKDVPYQFFDRPNLKQSYLTTDQLMDFQTILNNFDTEIGIPTIPYQKKERMVTSEAESRIIDSTSRSVIWLETLNNSADIVNQHFGSNIRFSLRYAETEEGPQEGAEENVENDASGDVSAR